MFRVTSAFLQKCLLDLRMVPKTRRSMGQRTVQLCTNQGSLSNALMDALPNHQASLHVMHFACVGPVRVHAYL